MNDELYELKLANGKWVRWQGADGEDAAYRYADAHRGVTVVACREISTGVFVLGRAGQIIG